MNNTNKLRIYAFSLASAGIIGIFTTFYKPNANVKPNISDKYNNFKEFIDLRPRVNRLVDCYNKDNIAIFINKETLETTNYIHYEDLTINKVFELDTRDLIYYSDFTENTEYGQEYYKNLLDKSTIIDFRELDNYLKEYDEKEWYSEDEINELAIKLVETLKENKAVTKTLKK